MLRQPAIELLSDRFATSGDFPECNDPALRSLFPQHRSEQIEFVPFYNRSALRPHPLDTTRSPAVSSGLCLGTSTVAFALLSAEAVLRLIRSSISRWWRHYQSRVKQIFISKILSHLHSDECGILSLLVHNRAYGNDAQPQPSHALSRRAD